MSYNLPNPSLVGILLVVSTHNGPQIVYHYPPELSKQELLRLNPDEDSQNDDFDDEDYEEDDATKSETVVHTYKNSINSVLLGVSGCADSTSFRHARTDSTQRDTKCANDEPAKTPPVTILGFEPKVLAEMLCPPREMCNCRFEVTLESMVFSGLPVHVLLDGSWRPRKGRSRHSDPHTNAVNSVSGAPGGSGSVMPLTTGGTLNENAEDESDPDASRRTLRMFHLVFIMDPPKIERCYRNDEMFYYVILKLLSILCYEQHKRDYIWDQVKLVSRLKDEYLASAEPPVDSLSDYLLGGLLLCKMMNQCFLALVASRIAHLNINNKLHSLQIPLKMEFHSLPELFTPYVPGSYLSSTTSYLGETGLVSVGETMRYSCNNLLDQVLGNEFIADEQDDDLDDDEYLTSSDELLHLGLLLWDDPETIIKEIKAKSNSPIAVFIRMNRPTESLLRVYSRLKQQHEGELDLNISNIRNFALHLVHWRKARMIPPLNARGIYIVSPMAPIASRLNRDIAKFRQRFPAIPSLPQFLKSLSTRSKKPRQFASIVPSKDHRDIYLQALAWLVRYGYATQLHTYIWLKVSRKIKMKVEEELETELGNDLKRGSKRYPDSPSGSSDNKIITSVDNSSKQRDSSNADATEDEIDRFQRRLDLSESPDIILENDGDTILVDPGRASTLERRWINEIIHKECELSPELTVIFYKLLKFMNGRNSLEIFLLKENITRTDLRKLLLAIENHVISVRHW